MSRRLLVRAGAWLAVTAAVMSVPLFTDSRYLLKNVLAQGVGVNVLVIIGLALLFSYAGQISLGQAGFVGIGAYTSAIVTMRLGMPWPVGVLSAALIAALGGALLAIPSLRLKGHYLAMATLAFGELMRIFFREAEPLTGGFTGLSGIPAPTVAGVELDTPQAAYWLVWGTVLLALFLVYNVVALRPGRAMRALHGSELGTRACGVNVTRVKVEVFIISAALAGIAGSYYAHLVRYISPDNFTLHQSVIYVAMTVLGGTSSLAGPVLAGVGLTLLQYPGSVLPWLPDAIIDFIEEWELDIYALTIILVMLFAPGGLAGLLRRLRERLHVPGPAEEGSPP